MRKTQYYDTALKAAESVPVITKKCAGIESVEYDIEGYTTADAYVDILPRMNAGDSRISRFGFLFATTRQEGRGR